MKRKIVSCMLIFVVMFALLGLERASADNNVQPLKNELTTKMGKVAAKHTYPSLKIQASDKKMVLQANNDDDTDFEKEPNNDLKKANSYKLGRYMAGYFSKNDVDVFKVEVSKQGALIFGGTAGKDSPAELTFQLYNRYNKPVKILATEYQDAVLLQGYHVTPGQYYLKVSDKKKTSAESLYVIYGEHAADSPDRMAPSAPKVNAIGDSHTKITGKAEPYSTVKAKVNGKWINSGVKASITEAFSLKIPKLKAGTAVYVYAFDAAGNQSKAKKMTVKDTTPPKKLSVSKVTSRSKTVRGKTEARATIQIKRGSTTLGKAKATSSGSFTVKIKPQKKGTKLTVIAKDAKGNARTIKIKVK
ncbi:Ig-like domain-containing protein [Bacillus rubiinfantis]|uniref:Ig-like domain-containing protein n=1 Tax=Bacillus rubiinfantis TaxID=1499680 RepID=UPI000694A3C2|nr:Ig-like domain-containing protein [Bacillus rubiinfantis]